MTSKILEDVEIVVGIDFGTSYSGYAYSYKNCKEKRHLNSDWPSGSGATKEKTAILFNKEKNVHGVLEEKIYFGEKAVNKFVGLPVDQIKSCHFLIDSKWRCTMKRLVCS